MKNGYTKQEYDRQKRMLKNIYDAPQFAPQFYWNAKYKTEEMKDKVPYIGIQDLFDYKYVREFGISAFRREPTDKNLRMIH